MMEECNKRKRVSSDSPDSEPESKVHRVGLSLDVDSSEPQLTRVDSADSCLNTEIQDDLFDILDSENVVERDSPIQGLDSVIKSFEEEIFAPGSGLYPVDSNSVPDCSELQTSLNLGYLFEASDDELGLPPPAPESEEPGRVNPDEMDLNGFVDFEDDIPNYDAFGFDNELIAVCDGGNGGARTFTAVDGLFDFTETADILWRSESLHAM